MKKKLLSEAQVRRFMGLAGINPLNEMSHYNRDDDMSNEAMYQEGLMEEEDMAGDEMAGDEMPGAPMDGDDLPDEAGEADVEIDQDDLGDIKIGRAHV